MREEEFRSILERYQNGTATAEEIAWLEDNYIQWNKDFKREWSLELLEEYQDRVWERVDPATKNPKPILKRLWPLATAAALAAVLFGIWMYKGDPSQNVNKVEFAEVNDLAPGRNGATVTLANGEVIQLDSSKNGLIIGKDLKYEDQSTVLKGEKALEDIQILTASTARGQTYSFVLPDGSKVWLNADSKLEFLSNFSGSTERRAKLQGEAYFEIAKDKSHPFIVETEVIGGLPQQEIEVLGTHFNVNAYSNEPAIQTTLLEGSVKVASPTFNLTLIPGEQAVLSAKAMTKRVANTNEVTAWKNGDFDFNGETLEHIMRELSRWYNIEVVYEDDVQQKTFTGTISKNKNISQVLGLLGSTKVVKFKVKERRVIVSKY